MHQHLRLSLQSVNSLWEVPLLLDGLDKFSVSLLLGESSSDGSGLSSSHILREFRGAESGAVGFVIGTDGLSVLEVGLELFSGLLVGDGQDSSDGFSDDSDLGELGGNTGRHFSDL